jgi:hypothetical protein
MTFIPSWTLCLGANANHAAKPRNPVTSARLPVAQQVRRTVGKIFRIWNYRRYRQIPSLTQGKHLFRPVVGGSSVWSVSRLIAEILVQGRRGSYKLLTKIHTRGAFTISKITIHNISPWCLGPYYYNTVSPWVANGWDGFQTRANIFNMQKRTTDKRWSCSVGVGQGQILTCYEMGWKSLKLYRFLERRKQR